jgi:hypothetical protein
MPGQHAVARHQFGKQRLVAGRRSCCPAKPWNAPTFRCMIQTTQRASSVMRLWFSHSLDLPVRAEMAVRVIGMFLAVQAAMDVEYLAAPADHMSLWLLPTIGAVVWIMFRVVVRVWAGRSGVAVVPDRQYRKKLSNEWQSLSLSRRLLFLGPACALATWIGSQFTILIGVSHRGPEHAFFSGFMFLALVFSYAIVPKLVSKQAEFRLGPDGKIQQIER